MLTDEKNTVSAVSKSDKKKEKVYRYQDSISSKGEIKHKLKAKKEVMDDYTLDSTTESNDGFWG